jgi:hypothetical protein
MITIPRLLLLSLSALSLLVMAAKSESDASLDRTFLMSLHPAGEAIVCEAITLATVDPPNGNAAHGPAAASAILVCTWISVTHRRVDFFSSGQTRFIELECFEPVRHFHYFDPCENCG